MSIFLFSDISAIFGNNCLVARSHKEDESKQCQKEKKEVIDVIEGKRVILVDKDKRKRGDNKRNKIVLINERFVQEI